jgi:hypothetical protein
VPAGRGRTPWLCDAPPHSPRPPLGHRVTLTPTALRACRWPWPSRRWWPGGPHERLSSYLAGELVLRRQEGEGRAGNDPSPRHTTSHARDIGPASGRSGRECPYRRGPSELSSGCRSGRSGTSPGTPSAPSSSRTTSPIGGPQARSGVRRPDGWPPRRNPLTSWHWTPHDDREPTRQRQSG